jgi:alpha-glucosidase (family GH31 glycosyl hydrolase)
MIVMFRFARFAVALSSMCLFAGGRASAEVFSIKADGISFRIDSDGGRYSFASDGKATVGADTQAGVMLAGSPVSFRPDGACDGSTCRIAGTSASGRHVRLTVKLSPHQAELIAEPQEQGDEVRFVTAGAAPAYGLADHAVEQKLFSTLPDKQFSTDVSGFVDDKYLSGQGGVRLVSNFVIYPKQRFAELLVDPSMKIIHTSAQQIVQGVVHTSSAVHLFYFFGDPHAIYDQYLQVRNAMGYKVFMPKYEAFGVGWEAFGALGWETNQKTVQANVDRYIAEHYPLRWAVIGSGFWPSAPEMHETTSFGLWDHEKYPDPKALIQHFTDEHLAVMLGLRITFITTGPYSAEGAAKGYFLEKDGRPEAFRGGWPKLPYYLLDAHNPAALDWYMALVKRWQDYGITGWKEDFYGYGNYDLRDDKVDPVNDRLMLQKQLVIERNGYLSSNGDLHRINDFNYDQNQDRGPVNALALAYSGFPLVYPDIVGGTFGENHFATERSPKMEMYMMRNAQWAALHSSMGMGEPPWTFSPRVASVMLQAAKLHAQIAPYIYSNARRFATDGYPWTMTPLPIAFPDDPKSYGREDAHNRAYEWMIGDALLATPLYGEDYAESDTRDIYLPQGEWMDFDTGKLFQGGQTLKGFELPPGKTPLFVGGSGVTLEDRGGGVLICVYPVATHAAADVTLPSGGDSVHVSVKGLGAGVPWKGVSVLDANGHSVKVNASNRAFTFTPEAGGSYRVTATADHVN